MLPHRPVAHVNVGDRGKEEEDGGNREHPSRTKPVVFAAILLLLLFIFGLLLMIPGEEDAKAPHGETTALTSRKTTKTTKTTNSTTSSTTTTTKAPLGLLCTTNPERVTLLLKLADVCQKFLLNVNRQNDQPDSPVDNFIKVFKPKVILTYNMHGSTYEEATAFVGAFSFWDKHPHGFTDLRLNEEGLKSLQQ
ncbi:hypothetical protein MTO96_052097, partial [Rhipicephalus appendiculatus]